MNKIYNAIGLMSGTSADGFAFIAARTLNKLPSSFPTTTNCKTPTICGKLYKPNI